MAPIAVRLSLVDSREAAFSQRELHATKSYGMWLSDIVLPRSLLKSDVEKSFDVAVTLVHWLCSWWY